MEILTREKQQANASYLTMLLNHRCLTYNQLSQLAELSDNELSAALGWLMRDEELFVSTEDGREYFELRQDYDF